MLDDETVRDADVKPQGSLDRVEHEFNSEQWMSEIDEVEEDNNELEYHMRKDGIIK